MAGPASGRWGRDLRETLSILVLGSLAALAAGLVLSVSTPVLRAAPGLLVVVPAIISARGNIFATFGARLGSYLHLGVLPVKVRQGREGPRLRWGLRRLLTTPVMRQNAYALTALSFATGAGIGLLGAALGLFIGVPADWPLLVLASVAASLLSGVVLYVVSIATAVGAYVNGWDPDNVTAPVITLAGDVLTLVFLVLVVTPLATLPSWLATGLAVASVATGVVLVAAPYVRKAKPQVLRILGESLPFFMLAAVISSLAGVFLGHREDAFLESPGLLTLVPAFLGVGGSMGSILAARVSTGLHMGTMQARLLPTARVWGFVGLLHVVGLVVFPVLGAGAWVVNDVFAIVGPSALGLVVLAAVAGLILVAAVDAVAYVTTVVAYRRGLDPDNMVVPVVASSIDLAGAALLVGVGLAMGIL